MPAEFRTGGVRLAISATSVILEFGAVEVDMKADMSTATTQPAIMLKRVLVTTDFSPESRKAFTYAATLAAEFNATLDVLAVVERPPFLSGMEVVPIAMDTSESRSAAERRLVEWIREEVPSTVHATPLIREGKADREIIDAAAERGTDLIVIATHGYSGLKHAIMGSTTEKVVRHAPCPVLVVRQREHDFVPDLQVQEGREFSRPSDRPDQP